MNRGTIRLKPKTLTTADKSAWLARAEAQKSVTTARRPRPPKKPRPWDAEDIVEYTRGHPLVLGRGVNNYRYADDLTSVWDQNGVSIERPCVRCGVQAEPDGPDPCLGLLPGVVAACCGHGVEQPYVAFRLDGNPYREKEPGDVLRNGDALAYFKQCGVGPHCCKEE